MREIKFRLRIGSEIVGYEKWYGGSFSKSNGQTAHPCWLYSKDNKYWNPNFIWHEQKDQYTGLPDKNGKEIYEGDIVEADWGYGCPRREVEFDMIYYANAECSLSDEIKIIGNIYENPELLKGGEKW